MNKEMQKTDEMQDEELYALLDRAFETDRLCVSEDLIQKTLARVAEDQESKVISFEKAAKRRIPAVKYIGVAVAAVLVVVVGVRTLGNGKVSMDTAPMEVKFDNTGAGYRVETEAMDERGVATSDSRKAGTEYSYSMNDSDVVTNHEAVGDMLADAVVPKDDVTGTQFPGSEVREESESVSVLTGAWLPISAEMTEALTAVGAEPVSGKAEYWELVQRDTTWERELFYELAAGMDVFGEILPEDGRYRYELGCGDGSVQTVSTDGPLDGIVRVETKKGILWGVFGEYTRFYTE